LEDSVQDERESVIAHIDGKAAFCEGRQDDVTNGPWYRGLARLYRTLSEDIRGGLHHRDPAVTVPDQVEPS
jgi:hypothetical protein